MRRDYLPVSFFSAVLVLATFGFLGLATLFDVIDGPGTPRQELEARTPDWPESLSAWPRFLADARFHATERYALKDFFISTNAAVKLDLFGHSDTPKVGLGKNGFLFLTTEGPILIAQGRKRLDYDGKIEWRAYFTRLRAAFAKHGLSYGLIIGPDKHSIYPDFLPGWVNPVSAERTRTQDIAAIAREELATGFTDARPLLQARRAADPSTLLYHPTDTHWTELGAALAVGDLLARLGITLDQPEYAIKALPRSGDLARMLGRQQVLEAMGPVLPRGWHCEDETGTDLTVETIDPLMPRRFHCGSPEGRPETVVAFIDSFGVGTIPYLASHFRRVEFIWTDAADPNQAIALGADLVLQILVERKLTTDQPESFLVTDP